MSDLPPGLGKVRNIWLENGKRVVGCYKHGVNAAFLLYVPKNVHPIPVCPECFKLECGGLKDAVLRDQGEEEELEGDEKCAFCTVPGGEFDAAAICVVCDRPICTTHWHPGELCPDCAAASGFFKDDVFATARHTRHEPFDELEYAKERSKRHGFTIH